MKTTRDRTIIESLSNEDQSKAYLFVGKFIGDFALLEMTIDSAIVSFFQIDSSLNAYRIKDIYKKNTSITKILEHSVLGYKFFNFQNKIEAVKAIIQDSTPRLFTKYGNLLFDLIDKLQQARNLLAHHKTYMYKGQLIVAKPKANFKITKSGTQKGGIIPEPIGEYHPRYEKQIITNDAENKIALQISHVILVLSMYMIVEIHGKRKTKNLIEFWDDKNLEKTMSREAMYKGGIFDWAILN